MGSTITTDDILAELAERYTRIGPQPGEITIKMFAERAGISETTALINLQKEVAAGRLVELKGGRASKNGKNVRVWRRP